MILRIENITYLISEKNQHTIHIHPFMFQRFQPILQCVWLLRKWQSATVRKWYLDTSELRYVIV